MRYCFIKRAENGFDFCVTTNDGFNGHEKSLKEYRYSDSDFQSISNGKFFIIYENVYKVEESFAKMFFEDVLKDRNDLEIDEVRFDLTEAIKSLFKDCKRLQIGDKKEEIRDRMSGEIIIIAPSGMYRIESNFAIEKLDRYYNRNSVEVLSQCEIIGDVSPLELMEAFIKDYKEHGFRINYPIVYGNTSLDFVTIRDRDDNEVKVGKEEFVCHW